MGTDKQVATLLSLDPAARVVLGNTLAVALLVCSFRDAGAHRQVTVLADRAASCAPLGQARHLYAHPAAAVLLVRALRLADADNQVGADNQAAALADRLPGSVPGPW